MNSTEFLSALEEFANEKKFVGKGPLCVALVVTERCKKFGLPLIQEKLVTPGGGQVAGLGRNQVQAILARHDITRVLAQEGGRTSRGSLGRMREYVEFLNAMNTQFDICIDEVEEFWVDRIRKFFAANPFRIEIDSSRGLRSIVRFVINQAASRQLESGSTHYAGALLQHLVGTTLDCNLGEGAIQHNSYSTSDFQSGRTGDFSLGDVAIHVTTSPSEALIDKCVRNLDANLRPIIVTLESGVPVAIGLASNKQIERRLDVFEVEQFVVFNLYKMANFRADRRVRAIATFTSRYNEIIDKVETDPSLKIQLA